MVASFVVCAFIMFSGCGGNVSGQFLKEGVVGDDHSSVDSREGHVVCLLNSHG